MCISGDVWILEEQVLRRQNLLTTLALQASLLVSGCFGAWSYTVPLVPRTVATECTMWLKRTAALAPCRRAEAPG